MDTTYLVIVVIIGTVVAIISDPNNKRGKR